MQSSRRCPMVVTAIAAVVAASLAAPVVLAQSPAPSAPAVYFINLKDRDIVTSPFRVQFGLSGMGVAPAGVEKEKTGHHHLLIDTKLTADELKAPIPSDQQHLHFGGGQTETILTLAPGEHTLQLVLGNWSHVPFDPPIISPIITIIVK